MTLLAWIAYCNGQKTLAREEGARPRRTYLCEEGKRCNPWTCENYTDGFEMHCPDCTFDGFYFTPDPTIEKERPDFEKLLKNIGLPKPQQQSLF